MSGLQSRSPELNTMLFFYILLYMLTMLVHLVEAVHRVYAYFRKLENHKATALYTGHSTHHVIGLYDFRYIRQ